MADQSIADPIPPNFTSLPIPPLDPSIFSDDLTLPDNDFVSDLGIFDDDVENFDFIFDDLYLPSENEDFLKTLSSEFRAHGSDPVQMFADVPRVSNSPSSESESFDHGFSGDRSSSGARVLNSPSPPLCQVSGDQSSDVDRFLDIPSPESENHNRDVSVSGPASSQGSGNCGSDVSEALNYPSPDSGNCARSVDSSPIFADNSIHGDVVQKIKLEDLSKNCLLKRKKANEDVNFESRTTKYHKSNDIDSETNGEEDKKKARLMRNRESAQLSRQRKKHYVEELEDKVRAMHSTIQDLNTKISYMMAENAGLRQQLSGNPMCPPPGMYPHPPMAPMGYPWMPYVVKPQGSQVPLVPIPRLKPQQPVSAPKPKKIESKKLEGKSKSKKVASVSFLGLLLFILLFGGLVPMINVNYGGMREVGPGGSNYFGNRVYEEHHDRVLMAKGHQNGTDLNFGIGLSNGKLTDTIHCGSEPKERAPVRSGNGSEPLVASLYVPRNDKLVKIDGNLIIHSVLASEKAMASREATEMKRGRETSLAVAKNLAPAIPVSGRHHHPHVYRSMTEQQRALASGAAEKDNMKSKSADGKLQQWFRDGLAGPMLHSGMCTEVFQFDVSPASAGAIIPATSVRNMSAENNQNSTHINKGRNRRILHGLPIPLPGSVNISNERVGRNSEKDNFHGNNSLSSSSMVVSVLVDPREVGDGDGDGMMGSTKSLSRIFVVVLLDSVKYVTYSCMLPFKGSVLI